MKEFNELYATNDYLMGELILARQANEVLTESNRRMERLLIKCIKDLQDCNRLLDEMKHQVGELATVALARVKQL
jgi:hypothetical protein